MAPRLDAQDARQGKKGTPVLRVLIIALVLAVIAFIGMQIYGGMQPNENIPGAQVGGDTSPATAPATTGTTGTTVTPGAATTNP
ncbi:MULTISPECIES: hypothetical protein [unclassified Aureimonas]|uniref:hypothetical protein n=1 Tax=unclassified Aureimonas TaxID=2615206 RepID=UPI0006FBC9F3|nr:MULTISPECIES: hypothetical protein [unclassified Aureimonas]KQT64210.1 hypothetical protein ASG62_04245 [Aureimonas sp. Leaf427]KQT81399.1 hypothetical protein ASG54_01515 [Aureimonas sp. Leaf460]